MRAAVFHGAGDIRLSDVPDPSAGTGEVVVKVHRDDEVRRNVDRYGRSRRR